ncbi:MAG: sulfatase [Clostridia bacterium]
MKKPNIISILIDDLGARDLGCYGSTFYETPNIDKLASEGLVFTDAYASCPVCSPSRASMMTGKYPARVGVTEWIGGDTKGKLLGAPYLHYLPLEEVCIAKAMKKGGYRTWHVGKWHLGTEEYYPEKHGFDVNIGGCHRGAPNNGYFAPHGLHNLEGGNSDEYLTDRITDEAIKLIEQESDEPFFLNLCHYAVHVPLVAKQNDIDYFTEKAKKLKLDRFNAITLGEKYPIEDKKSSCVERRHIQSHPVYAAMIYNLDQNIGKLMDALKATGKDKDTIVFFTSDNGGLSTEFLCPTCNAPFSEGKGWMYEGGVREPLIIWGKGIEKRRFCTVPVTTPDFYPTFLELAGLPLMPEQHVDGVSLVPLINGENKLEREAIYWHYPHYGNQGGTPGCSVRMGDYKLIEFFEDSRLELYNLKTDVSELNNLADEMPELREKILGKLNAWLDDVCAKIPQPNPNWKAKPEMKRS